MWERLPEVARPSEANDRARLENQVLALQSMIAFAFCIGALSGAFGIEGLLRNWIVAWIVVYHVAHAIYVLTRRSPGRPIAWIETATPICDVTCITAGWALIGDPSHPLWAVYLYALVGYARRYEGRRYELLAAFIVLNLVVGHTLISLSAETPLVDSSILTMIVLTAAMGVLSGAVGAGWRRAERKARLLSEVDPLTGIANRRIFLERLDELSHAGGVFSVLMLDLDDFKRLNDEFGHLHGDAVLQRVARVLSDSVRDGDRLARYGGEEFVVAMPGANLSEAIAVAERLRQAIAEGTPTTVSIGCAARYPGEAAIDVLRRADDLLLVAKRTGKNTVRSEGLRRSA
ncbi:MAG: GGDEF domain-containing protein [Tepidiformaceae bacterium]